MTNSDPFVITISRQLGSGGGNLGRRLATELDIAYADRVILDRAAESLQVKAEDLEVRDETAPSFLETVFESFTLGVPEATYVPAIELPTYTELRTAESAVIREIAARRSAVIVGRGGCHFLAEHPRHLSVFIHAELGFRVERVQEVYNLPRDEALRVIDESDRARGRYLMALTGRPWTDALGYDVSLCSSALGLTFAGQALCDIARARFC
jgi:cytidylate kinase